MAHNARVEELSDTDSDPPEADLSTYTNTVAVPEPSIPSLRHQSHQPSSSHPTPPGTSSGRPFNPNPPPDYKTYVCLYPIYFDSLRSRAEGRRVSKSKAVPNPLAREIVDAVQALGLKTVFEPGKMHPKDWSNPGRVRVGGLRGEDAVQSGRVKNKHHLYILVCDFLRQHPATNMTPLRLRIHGMPTPEGPAPEPAVPKGWKISRILPLHSPALSGGGVSENILKDIMDEAQGTPPGSGQTAVAEGQGKRKREGGKKK